MRLHVLVVVAAFATLQHVSGEDFELDWEVGIGANVETVIEVGDTVRWVWTDAAPHTVSPIGNDIQAGFGQTRLDGVGTTYEFTFEEAGSFGYQCEIHPGSMGGVIVVNGANDGDVLIWGLDFDEVRRINIGESLTWEWADDGLEHSIAVTGSSATATEMEVTRQTFPFTKSVTFNEEGEFNYLCGVHPDSMRGTVQVVDPDNFRLDWDLDFGFNVITEIEIGQSITWVWNDERPHTVVGIGPTPEGLNVDVSKIAPFEHRFEFNVAGDFHYFCNIHPKTMRGIIRVIDPLNPPPECDGLLIEWSTQHGVDQNYEINIGQTVCWVWTDEEPHTVTGLGENIPDDFGQSSLSGVGQQYEFEFEEAGVFGFQSVDDINPEMSGTITVVDPDSDDEDVNAGGLRIGWSVAAFQPNTNYQIGVGDSVTWVWSDDAEHTLTAVGTALPASFGTNLTRIAERGFSVTETFATEGVFPFRCDAHPNAMIGTITVGNPPDVELDWEVGIGANVETEIEVGDTVRWVWTDAAPHTVSPIGNDIQVGFGQTQDLAGVGTTYEFTFEEAGSFGYQCDIHPGSMNGVIVVNGAPALETVVEIDWELNQIDLETRIEIGETVRWVWTDNAPHTVTAIGNSIPAGFGFTESRSGALIVTYEFEFSEEGAYEYQCDIHPGTMNGVIIVGDAVYPNPDVAGSASRQSTAVAMAVAALGASLALN